MSNARTIYFTLSGLLALLLLVSGCRGGENTKQAASPAPAIPSSDQDRTPYYYGLIEEYQTVLAEDPHNLAAITALGNALFDAGQWKEAIRHYEQALLINPHNADVITDMGTCYRNLGMPDKAIAEFQRALNIEPVHQNALYNLGVVYAYDKRDYRNAMDVWDRLLHVAPKHPRADSLRAAMLTFRRHQPKAADQ